jgi:hypothetical protein
MGRPANQLREEYLRNQQELLADQLAATYVELEQELVASRKVTIERRISALDAESCTSGQPGDLSAPPAAAGGRGGLWQDQPGAGGRL